MAGGRGAALADPEGIRFRLWQAKRRLGAQAVNQPRSWNFSDLHTGNAARQAEIAAPPGFEDAIGWVVPT